MKLKIRVNKFSQEYKHNLKQFVCEYDIPKAQQNSVYYIYYQNSWIKLYLIEGVFYYYGKVSTFEAWYDTATEEVLLKGKELRFVPDKYLKREAIFLKDGYNRFKRFKDEIRSWRLKRIKNKKQYDEKKA